MPTFNLLPWREEAKRQRQIQFNTMAGATFAIAVVMVLLVTTLIDNAVVLQQQKNNYVRQEIQVVDHKIEEIKELRQAKNNLRRRMDLIERLQNTRNLSTHLLDSIASVISPGVYLNSVSRKGSTISFKGLAESNNHLANMLRNIESSQWLRNPLVQHINVKKGEIRQLNSFALRVDVNTALKKGGQ